MSKSKNVYVRRTHEGSRGKESVGEVEEEEIILSRSLLHKAKNEMRQAAAAAVSSKLIKLSESHTKK